MIEMLASPPSQPPAGMVDGTAPSGDPGALFAALLAGLVAPAAGTQGTPPTGDPLAGVARRPRAAVGEGAAVVEAGEARAVTVGPVAIGSGTRMGANAPGIGKGVPFASGAVSFPPTDAAGGEAAEDGVPSFPVADGSAQGRETAAPSTVVAKVSPALRRGVLPSPVETGVPTTSPMPEAVRKPAIEDGVLLRLPGAARLVALMTEVPDAAKGERLAVPRPGVPRPAAVAPRAAPLVPPAANGMPAVAGGPPPSVEPRGEPLLSDETRPLPELLRQKDVEPDGAPEARLAADRGVTHGTSTARDDARQVPSATGPAPRPAATPAPIVEAVGTEPGRDDGPLGRDPGDGFVPSPATGAARGGGAPQASAGTTPVPPPPPVYTAAVSRVGMYVVQAAADRLSRLVVQLEPAALGRVEITLRFKDDGRVAASFRAQQGDALQMLRAEAPNFARLFAEQGIELAAGGLDFGLMGDHDRTAGEGGREPRTAEPAATSQVAPAAAPVGRAVSRTGLVDLTV